MSIEVRNLKMTYRVPVRPDGLGAAFRSIARREYREIRAVKDVSLSIGAGQIVGFIGPNGAGKTTTLKMLSGILHPTEGTVDVLGFLPWGRDPKFLRQIAMIRGSQPISGPAELTVMDSLRLQQRIYGIPASDFRRNLDRLATMLELGPLLDRQIRALSLGERMRCGFTMSLIYGPKVLFLDEPTIGMDVSVVESTRSFIRRYCEETDATILLTSHYVGDVEELCERVILIDHGSIAYDGSLDALVNRISPFKLIRITTSGESTEDWSRYGALVEGDDSIVSIQVPKNDALSVVRAMLAANVDITDLSIAEPPIERVISQVYREGLG